MKSTLFSMLGTAALVYFGICAVLYFLQRSMIYYPVPSPGEVSAEELWIDSGGERLRVWEVDGARPRALVYFGGNAENVAWNLADFRLTFPDRALYLVNYRGYGGSTGRPSEAALYADAVAVFDRIAARHDGIAVMGRSLGSGVATHLATARPVEKLVLVTPPDSFVTLARRFYPFVPVSLLLRDRYDSLSRADRLDVPVLIVVADRDEIVPRRSSERLARAIDARLLRWEVIEDSSHNTLHERPEYRRVLGAFVVEAPQ